MVPRLVSRTPPCRAAPASRTRRRTTVPTDPDDEPAEHECPGEESQLDEFATAVRTAIAASGLSLDRIQHRLAERGVSVSLATLSYWQSGRSRPGRRQSLVVLDHLEAVLDLERASLSSLVGPVRPRGRGPQGVREVMSLAMLWRDHASVSEAFDHIDTRWDDQLSRISRHDQLRIGADRTEARLSVRQVLRAQCDGVDRSVLMHWLDEPGTALPQVRALLHCDLGLTYSDPENGVVVAELLFDRTLAQGETIIIEHELVHSPGGPVSSSFERRGRLPIRQYVLEVCFDPAALPSHCEQYSHPTDPGEPERSRRITIDSSGCAHAVVLDFAPGAFGMRWGWT